MKTSIVSRLALLVAALAALPAWATGVPGQGTWETTLLPRYFDGDAIPDAYYDTVLDITWLADANYAGTNMYLVDASVWAASLSFGPSGQWNSWRLPFVVDTDSPDDPDALGGDGCFIQQAFSGTDCGYNVQTISGSTVYSEMAHMFYVTLGNIGSIDTEGTWTGCPVPLACWTNAGPFTNHQGSLYWSNTSYAPGGGNAWYFDFNAGLQYVASKNTGLYAWAVHPGDVGAAAPVPVPAAAWLFGSGLVGLLGIGRRRRLALR